MEALALGRAVEDMVGAVAAAPEDSEAAQDEEAVAAGETEATAQTGSLRGALAPGCCSSLAHSPAERDRAQGIDVSAHSNGISAARGRVRLAWRTII